MNHFQTNMIDRNREKHEPDIQIDNSSIHMLVVDDEEMMRNLLMMSLQRLGYKVTAVDNGLTALDLFEKNQYDLILLDVMMPGMDGFAVCTELRKRSDVPVIMLTALNRPDDIVWGLELGADNYITKPFTFKEIEARIRAILRRVARANERHNAFNIMQHGDLRIDNDMKEVSINGDQIQLTRTEYHLLHYLMSHAGQPVSKNNLLQDVWGYESADSSNLVELAIRRLRKKIEEDPSQPERLVTVRGAGYKLCAAKPKHNRPQTNLNGVGHRSSPNHFVPQPQKSVVTQGRAGETIARMALS